MRKTTIGFTLGGVLFALCSFAEAQIVQETPAAIEVRVVPRPEWNADRARELEKEIRARLGDEIRVELRMVDAIAREPNGKFRAVKSRIGLADVGAAAGAEPRP